ncbi:MAG: hypothetical protein H7Y02_08740 [Candidatus Obscuribacterales bacterium]|nr:hypothetical protein [Steroidobacteraceae bacterium]
MAWSQRSLDEQLTVKFRRAIVVTNTPIAYLGRLAFGDGDYRVFYNDIAGAIEWLKSSS